MDAVLPTPKPARSPEARHRKARLAPGYPRRCVRFGKRSRERDFAPSRDSSQDGSPAVAGLSAGVARVMKRVRFAMTRRLRCAGFQAGVAGGAGSVREEPRPSYFGSPSGSSAPSSSSSSFLSAVSFARASAAAFSALAMSDFRLVRRFLVSKVARYAWNAADFE